MIARGAANSSLEVLGALIERMGRSPLLAGVAPVCGAVEILMAQVKAVSAEARLVMRGGKLRRIMVEDLTLQLLKEFHRSLDEESI